MIYLLLKAAHVVAVVTFVGGLLMLSVGVRIANLAVHRAVRRWDRSVTAPALALVWITGIAIALSGHWFGAAWLSVKLVVVTALSALHGMLAGTLRRMERDDLVVVPAQWLGHAAGAVAVATGIVVGLVVIKPF
ncbi:CopD family protein [Burkholderia pyrrocinia]|uniref:CopD family protein n=1 Tax=Burkholderia pyrrocinia TaxID=60550 RepID=UPI0015766269|nr:CopD family protein [Burkholderia pyrrocinia]NTX29293.1 CopD family protein [Burkholderia pyrrocinia]QVN20643.1 CopD family protein [Burkholderia pyrrocinia]